MALDGDVVWTKSVGNPVGGINAFAGLGAGNPQLIYDECWGIRGTADGGAIIACGTGIEGCENWTPGSEIRNECDADPRKTWRGFVIKIDKNGNEIWHRVDSFQEPGDTEAVDSASEYVSLTSDGRVISIVDQGFGIGILVLNSEEGNVDNTGDSDNGADNNGANQDDESLGSGCHISNSKNDSNLVVLFFGLFCVLAYWGRRKKSDIGN